MARPAKSRKVCRLPMCWNFYGSQGSDSGIVLTVEEYETIRLIDYMGFSQEECARQMEGSRATIQALYTEARKKLARFLVEGASLKIEGGNYTLCEQKAKGKGEKRMKIAVTYDNGQVFQHFGHTEQFKLYDIENGKVVASEVVGTNGSGHGALAGFLAEHQVQVLICGGIGGGAQNALAQAGIKLFGGCSGNADQAVEALLEGQLNYDADVKCSHHDHEHGEGGHQCGNHGCGSHSCH